MITSPVLLDPEVAFGTLLEFLISCELYEDLISLFRSIAFLILFTSHAFVIFYFTIQAINFEALGTSKGFYRVKIADEEILAVGSRTPYHHIII